MAEPACRRFTKGRWQGAKPVLLDSGRNPKLEVENNYGSVAEWLGRGLQNLLRRFESARDLNIVTKPTDNQCITVGFYFWFPNSFPNHLDYLDLQYA